MSEITFEIATDPKYIVVKRVKNNRKKVIATLRRYPKGWAFYLSIYPPIYSHELDDILAEIDDMNGRNGL